MKEPDKEYAAAPSAGLQAQDMDAVAIRTHWSTDVVRASRGRYHRTGMAARSLRMHWSHGHDHRAGMDALAIRMHWSHGRYLRLDEQPQCRSHKTACHMSQPACDRCLGGL